MNIEEIYRAHQNIIFHLAHRFTCPGLDFDELVSFGNATFMECATRYDGEHNNGACFSTYLFASLKINMMNAARTVVQDNWGKPDARPYLDRCDDKEFPNNPGMSMFNMPGPSTDIADDSTNPERQTRFKLALDALTSDAQEVVWIALSAPTDVIQDMPRLNKDAIRRHLLTIWKGENVQYRITAVFKEIGLALKNL